MKNLLMGTMKIDNDKKPLRLQDSKGFVPLAKLGLNDDFYGGRIDNLAKIDQTGVYLVVEGEHVIDVLIEKTESLTKAQIVSLAETKFGKNLNIKDNKDLLMKQFEALYRA